MKRFDLDASKRRKQPSPHPTLSNGVCDSTCSLNSDVMHHAVNYVQGDDLG